MAIETEKHVHMHGGMIATVLFILVGMIHDYFFDTVSYLIFTEAILIIYYRLFVPVKDPISIELNKDSSYIVSHTIFVNVFPMFVTYYYNWSGTTFAIITILFLSFHRIAWLFALDNRKKIEEKQKKSKDE